MKILNDLKYTYYTTRVLAEEYPVLQFEKYKNCSSLKSCKSEKELKKKEKKRIEENEGVEK